MMESIEKWFSEPLEERCKLIQRFQSIRCKPLDYLANFASFLSDEAFYVSLFPVLHYAIASELCVHVALLMSTGFVFGNMLKNTFCIPRPSAQLIHRARPSDADDYSMPSTHSLQAVSLPIWLTCYLIRDYGFTSPGFLLWWFPFVIFWALLLSWSRLYLGAHSLQDVVAGWVVGAVLGVSYCFFYPSWEVKLMAGDVQFASQVIAFAVLIMYLHPMEVFINTSLSKWSIIVSQSGYLTSCDLAGVLAGASLGATSMPKNVPISVFERPYAALFRFTVGPILAATVYVLARKTLRSLLLIGYNAVGIPLFDPPAKQAQIPPTLTLKKEGDRVSFETLNVHTWTNGPSPNFQRLTQSRLGLLLLGSGFQIMPIAKFLQYAALAWTVCTGAPYVFLFFGL